MEKFTFQKAYTTLIGFSIIISCVGVDPNCDLYQELVMGQEYHISNHEYPQNYHPSTTCRWTARSSLGTRIVASCKDIQIPNSPNCNGDRLSVSLTGNRNFEDSHNYCGGGSFTLVSQSNLLTVGLLSTTYSIGGRFTCSLTTVYNTNTTNPTTDLRACDCGWKQESRIVGGEETGVHEFPSMAGLIDLTLQDLYCGATIISYRYVITAAHCVYNRAANSIGVLVGDHNITTGTETAYSALYVANAYEIHPDYVVSTQINDLAIIQTVQEITFSIYVGPICLPFRYTGQDFYGQQVTALGWGQLEFSGSKSDTLQKVDLGVISNTECAPQQDNPIINGQMCTYADAKDACQSDSGGPLLWKDTSTNRLHLVGVISYGLACATTRPGVNTRMTYYLDWIVERTSDAGYCIA